MLKPALQLRLGQQLTMTPQLQQAIRLLQLPIVELQNQIQEALEGNVMLDMVEDMQESSGDQAEQKTAADNGAESGAESGDESVVVTDVPTMDDNWSDPSFSGSGESWQGDDRMVQEFADHSGNTLREHLIWQLRMEPLTAEDSVVGQALIDAINEDGYLTESLEVIRQCVGPDIITTEEQVERVLMIIQHFDPVGVGARSLSECLELQLNQLDPDTPGLALAHEIARHHLEQIASRQLAAVRRRLHTDEESLDQAVALVRSLHPRPGSAIYSVSAEYVVPDVYVRKMGDRWLVDVNAGVVPRLQVNQAYARLLTRDADHSVLRTQLQEARWLVRSLEIRNDTLLRVATCIVERQHEFLDHGDEAMRPMVLRDIAEKLDMHESTISRVTTNKYMHTPRGIFEFRHFFSSQVGGEGSEHSATAIRAMIRKMIANENSGKPLSDNAIAKLLVEDGVNVARRTVAKYREAMSIPSSGDRKRLAMR